MLKNALDAWSNVANIKFQSTTSTTPQFAIQEADNLQTYNLTKQTWESQIAFAGFGNVSGSQLLHRDMVINKNYVNNTTEGSYNYFIPLHEMGHILGLIDLDVGKKAYDHRNTIMSYNYSPSGAIPHTPMIYDIAAAQYLYGANEDHKKGDDTHAATGEKKLWTIWDAGGADDRIDIANAKGASKGAVIDLRGGVDANDDVRFSLIGKERIAIALDPKHDWEKPIEIEHAKGHDGDDVMLGNGGNNSLEGGAGIDTLIGGAGKDTLKGGSDADLISDSWWHTFDTSLKTDNSNDTLYGDGGDDELVSYDGRDLLDGKMDNQGTHAANDNILHKKLVMIKNYA